MSSDRHEGEREGDEHGVDLPACECDECVCEGICDRVDSAVQESVRRFVAVNRENIRGSPRERVAAASYGGGMMDMVAIIRDALGRWAVEQLLDELERWNGGGSCDDCSWLDIDDDGSEDCEGQCPGSADGPEERMARPIGAPKPGPRKPGPDPMFG